MSKTQSITTEVQKEKAISYKGLKKEINKIGTVLLGTTKLRKVNLLSVHTKEPYDYHWEADGEIFNGHQVLWDFDFRSYNYLKESGLSGDEYRKGGTMTIYRNGVSVFKEFCRNPERAFRVLAYKLPLLQEFNFKYLEVGRKIYNHDVPSVIERICDDGEIIVKTEDGSDVPWAFMQEQKKEGDYNDDWKDKDMVHILSEHIHWWRKK